MATNGNGRAATAVLEHSSARRMRVRLVKGDRTPAKLDRIRRHIENNPHVSSVQVNPKTGSVLIHSSNPASVRETLEDVVHLTMPFASDDSEPQVEAIVDAVRAVDDRIRAATGNKLSLKWIVPATFATMGVRQLMVQGFTLGVIPWYVLLYYSADSFLKLYPEHAPSAERGLF